MKIKLEKITALVLVLVMCTGLAACGGGKIEIEGESTVYHDSCGRDVEIPVDVDRVAGSGAVAQMILATIAPDKMCGLAATPSSSQMKYFPDYFLDLPTFGQFYGGKSTLNMESLIEADAQLVIDLGDKKTGHASDMNSIQKQTGIPTIFIETTLEKFPQAYRDLGTILGREEKGEACAEFIEKTIAMAEENSAKIPEDQRKSVMYASGTTGLNCNAEGSVQADVIDFVGAINAIVVDEKELSNAGGGNTISMEQLYNYDPDYIILSTGGPFSTLGTDPAWADLTAVKNDHYYEIPGEPYNWMSSPPSVNRILGIWWLGNLLYPDVYDYDMKEVTKEFYSLFYNYDLTDDEVDALLANSTIKAESQQS